jgi:hypothetical protein
LNILFHEFKLFAFALPGEKGGGTVLDESGLSLCESSDIWWHKVSRSDALALCPGLLCGRRMGTGRALRSRLGYRRRRRRFVCKVKELLGRDTGIRKSIGGHAGLEEAVGLDRRRG